VKRFMWSLGYNGCLAVDCVGRSGGLVLFSSFDTTCVWLQSLCTNFIDVKIKEDSGLWWRATFVYGEPKIDTFSRIYCIFLEPNGIDHECV
jgi:hypothetical protein